MFSHRVLFTLVVFQLASAAVAQGDKPPAEPKAAPPVLTGLWFVHRYGSPKALVPANDRQLKLALTGAFAKSHELSADAVGDWFDRAAFERLAGGKTMSPAAMERLVRDAVPASRKDMTEKTRLHADLLTTQFDLVEDGHRKAVDELADWIVRNYKPGKPLGVMAVCTGNTRRSVLSSTMGNVAAAYYGLPGVRFCSGGTEPDAINPRTVAALKAIGVEFEPTGVEAARGKPGVANPVYRVTWGKGLETEEFSKKYTDAKNPQDGFAAIMVCTEADSNCPTVTGAAVRIPVPFLDPKAFDGAAFEAAKYAERRDDIGRFMLAVMLQASRRLEASAK
jgi:hypothetical protein